MKLLKTSWNKERPLEIPQNVMENIAARGSFVVVKSKYLFRDITDKESPHQVQDTKVSDVGFTEYLNNKIKEMNFKMWLENVVENLASIKINYDISELPKSAGKTAIVLGAGPSFKEKNQIRFLKSLDPDKYSILVTDRMFIPLLENGIIPDFVVSADGHREKIAPFFQNDLITKDLKTSAVMSISVANNVVTLFPGKIYYFTPMLDDIEVPFSVTSALSIMTKTSILSTGGNVGITAIFLAYYLGYKKIVMIGMDQGYTMNTPIENSNYFPIVKEADPTITPELYKKKYTVEGFNKEYNLKYWTDITWKSQIDHIIAESETMAHKGVILINATEGGAIHGGAIRCMTFEEALS